jgi:hypothetical protein
MKITRSHSFLFMTKFAKIALGAFAVFAFVATAGSAKAAFMFNNNLSMGMSHPDVMELQKVLNMNASTMVASTGAGSMGMETMYFGSRTKAAVMAYQAANGISPVSGFVGPITRAKMNSGTTTTPTTPTSPSNLEGTDGTINSVDTVSSYSDEEVGEGQDDVKVASFEVEASNDGDIAMKSVKLVLDPSGNASGDSSHLDDYITGVSVWMGSTKIGSADVDDFSENSNDTYSKVVSLSNAVVQSDDTEKFYISVDAVSTFDSSDIDSDEWSVGIENIRYEDGSGVVTTLDGGDTVVDNGADQIGWNTLADGIEMDFVSFGTSADTELVFSTASDSPEADVVMVDDTTDTEDVVLLKGKMKLEGTSDVVIDEMPITFSPVGANINVMATSLKLVIGGEEYTESVPSIADAASGSVTFDNLDFSMDAGDTVEFEVLADMTDMDGTVFAEGDTLTASFTDSNRDVMDVENEEGDQLSDSSEKSGTSTGDAQEFRTEGIMLSLVSKTTSVTQGNSSNDDLGEFIIKFKVKAMGSSVYVSSLATASLTTTGTGAVAGVERSGTATIGGVSVTIVNTTDDDLTSVGNFLIEDGEEETFEMTTTVQLPAAGAGGQFRALLRALDWDIDDDASPDQSYTSNLDEFKTSYKALN